MTIEPLSQDEYEKLLLIQIMHSKLTFQNVGYQYIDRSTLSEEDKAILSKHIKRFVEFNNFLLNKKGELTVRFQYCYDSSFTGVGYITLRELLNGFDIEKEVTNEIN